MVQGGKTTKVSIYTRIAYTCTHIPFFYFMSDIIVTDAFGNTLSSGDSVQLIKELSVKGRSENLTVLPNDQF